MIPLPKWARPYLLEKKCPLCDCQTNLKDVDAVGVKFRSESSVATLVVWYLCSVCEQYVAFMIDPDDENITTRDIAISIVDSIDSSDKKIDTQKNKITKSKITQKEFNKFIKDLKDIKNHDDFMKYIGIPNKENNKKDKEDNKSDNENENK